MSHIKKITPYLLALLLLSCQTSPLSLAGNEPLVLSQTLFLSDLLDIQNSREQYENNLFVGDIRYSGGVIYDQNRGNMVRTKNIDLTPEKNFYVMEEEINKLVFNALTHEGYSVTPLKREDRNPGLTYRRETNITASEDEGNDNVNLPLYTYRLDPVPLDTLRSRGVNSGLVALPIIEHAYTHTGGWFYNQWGGTYAGVRLTLHLAVVNGSNGEILYYDTKTLKRIARKGTLSDFFLERYISEMLDEYRRHLSRTL